MNLIVETVITGPFQENSFIGWNSNSNEAFLVDPGDDVHLIINLIESKKLVPKAIINTHAHLDHIGAVQPLKEKYNIPFYLHEKDLATLHAVASYAHVYGFEKYNTSPDPDKFLKDGEVLSFGQINFKVYHTPGHATGHVVFYDEVNKFVINGDVLFNGSFGRVDLPGGDLETLKNSIFEVMFQLPDDTLVFCGHGPETTIGKEKKDNYIHQF